MKDEAGKFVAFRAWGDVVTVTGGDDTAAHVRIVNRDGAIVTGTVAKPSKSIQSVQDPDRKRVLKLDFVDVQQGDAAVLETPGGQVMLVDGGQNEMLSAYLASRYRHSGKSAEEPKRIDCIVVTHGDADHFAGLTKIVKREKKTKTRSGVFFHPHRVFHNGLVKRSATKATEAFGSTATVGDRTVVTDLYDDIRSVPDEKMNAEFKAWKRALEHWTDRGEIAVERLERGQDSKFKFLAREGIKVHVLGPTPIGHGAKRGLPLLMSPKTRVDGESEPSTSPSASHTINGHSIVLHVTYGNVRFLLAGDLNDESEAALVADAKAGKIDLSAEVLKVPHHGSHEYAPEFLKLTSPVVSVVSSGDESGFTEYIHPRATLVGALGRYGRPKVAEPVVFITELAAFFQKVGPVVDDKEGAFYAFKRTSYGIVHCRTDGDRLITYTHSGRPNQLEAYAFTVKDGAVKQSSFEVF